jgi:hypothetical protein
MDQSGTLFAMLDAQEALAQMLARQHEPGLARTVLEGVLDARRRQQGSEHGDTLRCSYRLALLFVQAGELGHARRLLEAILRACARQASRHGGARLAARSALALIFATQGDMAALGRLNDGG